MLERFQDVQLKAPGLEILDRLPADVYCDLPPSCEQYSECLLEIVYDRLLQNPYY
jgi:hypothetical protein